jgi:hypothetical protein
VGDYDEPAADHPRPDELVLRLYACPRFSNVPLAGITQLDVRTWVAELSARGLAPATVAKTYQVFGKVMGAAVDAGYLAQTPCRNVPLPKVEREEMRFITPAEIITLADAIRPLYRTLVLVGGTAAYASVSWRACAEAASTCCVARSTWPRL